MPRGRPAWPPRRLSRVGVPVEVVGRPSRGEGRVPGSDGVGWEMGLEGEEVDEERPRLRLRKDIAE